MTQVKAELERPFCRRSVGVGSLFGAAILLAKNLFGQGKPGVE